MIQFKAICQSLRCNDHKAVKNKAGAEKSVPKSASSCPDCGYSLLWVKVGARTLVNYVNSQPKEKR